MEQKKKQCKSQDVKSRRGTSMPNLNPSEEGAFASALSAKVPKEIERTLQATAKAIIDNGGGVWPDPPKCVYSRRTQRLNGSITHPDNPDFTHEPLSNDNAPFIDDGGEWPGPEI